MLQDLVKGAKGLGKGKGKGKVADGELECSALSGSTGTRTCCPGDVLMSINGDNCDSEDNDPTGLLDAQALLSRSKDVVTLRLISAPKDDSDTLVSCLRQMNMPHMVQLPLPVWCH